MENTTLLVTGGAGFIGSNFVHRALEKTQGRVVVLDKLTYAGNLANLASVNDEPRYEFVHGDIGDRELIDNLFKRLEPTAIVNFAAESHVDRSIDGPRPFIESNIVGTFELLESSRQFLDAHPDSRSSFRFLHVSTDEVYGTLGETGAFVETTPYAPNSPYSASKAAADHLVSAYHETFGIPTLITNCSNNYGPFQFPEKLIPLMILNALEGKDLPIYGDGLNVRDWLYVQDHCDAILRVLDKGRPGEKYNIGGNSERTNIAIVDTICELLEKHCPAAENPALQAGGKSSYEELKTFVTDRPGHDRRYAIDATKMRLELGWVPEHDFSSGMKLTVSWYHKNPDWCSDIQSGKYQRQRLGLSS
jgi:dTDP-glucose 4,6-dehydratase